MVAESPGKHRHTPHERLGNERKRRRRQDESSDSNEEGEKTKKMKMLDESINMLPCREFKGPGRHIKNLIIMWWSSIPSGPYLCEGYPNRSRGRSF